MAKKKYTHSKGFNVTSLQGIAGLYIFHNSKGEVVYIGMCNNDFKNRINSHNYGEHGKLSLDIVYIRVIIADPDIYPLHVLEHLFIWYFNPRFNDSLWLFSGARNGLEVKQIAKENNIYIQGSVKNFILSFESVLIEREWEDNSRFKRYGEIETLKSKNVSCTGMTNCLCYHCLVNNRH
jgi:hypothetical protein